MFDRFIHLKNCFVVPKFNYLIRTSPYWSHSGILKQFNDKFKDTLEGILDLKQENKNWIQATMPVSNGGSVIRKLSDISIPAFLASSYGTFALVSQILNLSDESNIQHMQEALDACSGVNTTIPTILHHQSAVTQVFSND